MLRAFDPLLQREVALKIPRLERLINGQPSDEFIKEAQISAGLVHPGIMRVYEIRRLGPIWYIASAFCNGPTLSGWTNRQSGGVPPRQAAMIIADVADAVHYAHSRGVLHLDLKLDNVLVELSEDTSLAPQPLVTDFGLARRSDCLDNRNGLRIAGTPAYMAPEQREGDSSRIGVASDIYALGAMLHDVLGHHHRIALCQVNSHGRGEVDNSARPSAIHVRGHLPHVSADLNAIVQKCLQTDPDLRYDSARDLSQDLRRFVRGELVNARRAHVAERLLRRIQRRPAISALCAVLIGTVIASIVIVGEQWRRAEATLVSLRSEQVSHARTAERMRKSLLNLTWLMEEKYVQRELPRSRDGMELNLLRDLYRDVENWSSSPSAEDAPDTGLQAAGHSLALVKGVSSVQDSREADFVAGLAAWKGVIGLEPNDEHWRRALALHVFTYAARLETPNWLWWRDTNSGERQIDPKTAAMFEETYADLLIRCAGNADAFKSPDTAGPMLVGAIQLLSEKRNCADPNNKRFRALLLAYNELARINERLSRQADCNSLLATAKSMVTAASTEITHTPEVAVVIGDLYKTCFKTRERTDDPRKRLWDLGLAADYYESALAALPADISLRMSLAEVHSSAGKLYEHASSQRSAINEFRKSLELLDAGLAIAPGHRQLTRERAIIKSNLGRVLSKIGDEKSAEQFLYGATLDFDDMELSKQDSTGLWMQAIRDWQLIGHYKAMSGERQLAVDAYETSLGLLERVKDRRGNTAQFREYLSRSRDALSTLQEL